jgi:uncharacterized protein (DUF2141 family)
VSWLLLFLFAAQQPTSVEGAVINSSTHEPIRKAVVLLRSRTGPNYAAETDASGKFYFRAVESGSYAVTADRLGFSMEASGASPKPLVVTGGQPMKDYEIRLIPQCAIAGRIVDEDSDPVRGITVEAYAYSYNSGKRQLQKKQSATTGNQGEYRLFGLLPGSYYVKAGSKDRFATFYPSSIDPNEAAPLRLAAGSEFRNIDIALRKVPTHSISGTLPDDPIDGTFTLIDIAPGIETINQTRNSRQFSFRGLRDGSYTLSAFRSEGQQISFAQQQVTVSGADVSGIELSFQPSKEVHGQVRFEGKAPPTKFENIRVTLAPDPKFQHVSDTAPLNRDGTFLFKALPPRLIDVSVGRVPGAYLKTVQLGDALLPNRRFDLSRTNGPLTITMGTDTAELEGTAKRATGEPAPRARITVIPYGQNLRRTELQRFGITAEDGTFHIKDIPPGEYKVFAWEDVETGAPQDPDFRKPFEDSGAPVKLEPNAHATVSLTAIKTHIE